MLGFEGTRLDAANRRLVAGLQLGGVTLFTRNVEDPGQVAVLTRELQSVVGAVPLFVSIDQEGGLVARVVNGGATVFPGNMALGATRDVDLARRVAIATGEELRAMGINLNLAPVVDVNTNPRNPVIGVRAFGSSVDVVAPFGVATVEGLRQAGVGAVAKHFPGHGDTAVDSHEALPVVPHALERLEAVELPPFQAAIAAGVDGIMTAHVYVPAIEPSPDVPATLSAAVLTGLLRERLGYDGLILTDALDMGAIKQGRTAAEAAVQAFEAGVDLLLIAGITAEDRARLGEGPPALLAAVRSGRVTEPRLDQSVRRVLQAKSRLGLLPDMAVGASVASLDASGAAPHQENRAGTTMADLAPTPGSAGSTLFDDDVHRSLALTAARQAVTLVRDDARLLPLDKQKRVLVVQPGDPTHAPVVDSFAADRLADALRPELRGVQDLALPSLPDTTAVNRAMAMAKLADVVVLATYDAVARPEQAALAEALVASGVPVVGVALRGPYDAAALSSVPTYLAVYGDRPVHLQVAAEALLGQLTPTGRVP